MRHANAVTTGTPARTPAAALDSLRARLADPMWQGWTVTMPVEVTDFGHNEFTATATLVTELDRAVKKCPHDLDPDDCTVCTPF